MIPYGKTSGWRSLSHVLYQDPWLLWQSNVFVVIKKKEVEVFAPFGDWNDAFSSGLINNLLPTCKFFTYSNTWNKAFHGSIMSQESIHVCQVNGLYASKIRQQKRSTSKFTVQITLCFRNIRIALQTPELWITKRSETCEIWQKSVKN